MLLKFQQYQQQKSNFIKKTPLLWFNGNESIVVTVLKNEVCEYYKNYQSHKKQGDFSNHKYTIQNITDWHQLFSEYENQGLFGEQEQQQFLEIHIEKPTAELLKPLEQLSSLGLHSVITSSRIDAKTQKLKWFIDLAELKDLAIITIFDLQDNELLEWSLSFAPQLTFTPQAKQWWQQKMSKNALASWQEAHKLNYIYPEKTTLDVTDLAFASGDFSQATIFDFSEKWLSGHKKQAFSLIQKLQQSGTSDLIIILWRIVSDLRTLLLIYEEIGEQNNLQIAGIAKKYGLWGEALNAITLAYKRYNIKEIQKRLQSAFTLEQQLKGKNSHGSLDYLNLLTLIK
jgi:DNA polymerase-3 subunit delta